MWRRDSCLIVEASPHISPLFWKANPRLLHDRPTRPRPSTTSTRPWEECFFETMRAIVQEGIIISTDALSRADATGPAWLDRVSRGLACRDVVIRMAYTLVFTPITLNPWSVLSRCASTVFSPLLVVLAKFVKTSTASFATPP